MAGSPVQEGFLRTGCSTGFPRAGSPAKPQLSTFFCLLLAAFKAAQGKGYIIYKRSGCLWSPVVKYVPYIYVYPLHFSGNICVQPALSAHFLHVYLKLWGRGEHFGAAGQPRGFTFANLDILSSCKLHLFLLSARIGVHAAGRCFLRLPAHSLIKGGWRVV